DSNNTSDNLTFMDVINISVSEYFQNTTPTKWSFDNFLETMKPFIMKEKKNTDELSSIWRKRFINALKITTNNAETDQTARQIATLLINQKQSSTITKFWKQLKIDKTYESAQERLQNKKSIFKVNSQIDAPDILEVFRTYQTIQVTSETNFQNSSSVIENENDKKRTKEPSIKETEIKQACNEKDKGFNPFYHVNESPTPMYLPLSESLIITPNKPIISQMMYSQYHAHIICAFNTTLTYLKKSLDNNTYESIKNTIYCGKKLIIKDHIVAKLNKIFECDYSKVEDTIITVTKIVDDQSDDSKFIYFIRHSLLDFVANFKYITPRALDRSMYERSYIVECLSPIFRSFRNSYPEIKYHWIEKIVESISGTNEMFMCDIDQRKTDISIVRISDEKEILNVEVSGPPSRNTKDHTVGDIKKLLSMAVCSLCCSLGDYLDCSIEDAKKIKSYSIQVIGNRLTLFAVSLFDKKKYLAIELSSCTIPFSYDSISCYMKIFNFFAIIRKEFLEQQELYKKFGSFHPTDNSTENLREWLHPPDVNLYPSKEDIDDTIFFMN
ncbi:3226_t:CDS:2, partial [Entrophospora sp. SA101]